MIDLLECVFAVTLLVVAGYFAYMSNVLVSERKERYRAGTHDYYDNPIKNKDK